MEANERFDIIATEQYGGKVTFLDYASLEKAFSAKELSSIDLKQGLSEELITLLAPLKEAIEGNKKLVDEAYP